MLDCREAGIFLPGVQDSLELSGEPDVIRLQKGHPVPPTARHGDVEGRGLPAMDQGQPIDPAEVRLDPRGGIVRGPVVNDQYLQRLKLLGQNALDAVRQERGAIVIADDDRK
jgi:hypothetical protein